MIDFLDSLKIFYIKLVFLLILNTIFIDRVSCNVEQYKFTYSRFSTVDPAWLRLLKVKRQSDDILVAPYTSVVNQTLEEGQTAMYEVTKLEKDTNYELRVSYPSWKPSKAKFHLFPASNRFFLLVNFTSTGVITPQSDLLSFVNPPFPYFLDSSSVNLESTELVRNRNRNSVPFTLTVEEIQLGVVPYAGWPVIGICAYSVSFSLFVIMPAYVSLFMQSLTD